MKRSKIENPTDSLVRSVGNAIKFASTNRGISDRSAHEARKSLKKARAALRLLRPVLGEPVYQRENAVFKNASHSVSPLRDARAQLDIVDSLDKRYARRNATTDLKPLKIRMRARLARMHRKITGSTRQVAHSVEELKKSRQRLIRLTRTCERPKQLTTALRKIYRQGRKALATAENRTTATTLHELRKKAKLLSNAVSVAGDGSGSAEKSTAKRVNCIADWLGEDHDLAVLMVDLRHVPPPISVQTKGRLRRLIGNRRAKLQKQSLRLAVDVYRRKPTKVFA